MTFQQFKQMTVGEIIDLAQALAEASSIENGSAKSGVMFKGEPVEDTAKELMMTFLDDVTPFSGTLEMLSDMAIEAVSSTDWVDKALGLVRFAVPMLDAKPLANLPF